MKSKDLNQLYRFQNHVTPGDLTLKFGVYGSELYNLIRIHGLVNTFHILPEDNRKKLLELINSF